MTITKGYIRAMASSITAHGMFMLLTGAVALLYMFRDQIFSGEILIGPEIWSQGVAVNNYAFSSLKNGVLPLWRPEIDLGYPILGEPAFSFWLHPINMLFFFLSAYTALNYLIIAHYALCLLFTYLFAMSLGINRIGSYMSALVYTFSSFMTSQVDQYSVAPAMVWLPLILLFINLAYKKGNPRFFALAGVVYGFQFFQSHIQFWSYTLVMIVLFTAYKALLNPSRTKSLWNEVGFAARGLALVLVAGLGIAAVKFLPLLELSGHGGRVESGEGGLSFLTASYYSMRLSDLVLLFFPDIYGAHFTSGFAGFNSEYSVERFCYIGVAALVLAATAVAIGKNEHKKFFAYTAVFSLLFAMGRDQPFYLLQFYLLPGFGNFQIPLRYLYLFSFSGAILAGICVDAASNGCQDASKEKMVRLAGRFILLIIGITGVIILTGSLLASDAAELNNFMRSIAGSYNSKLQGLVAAPMESLLSSGFYMEIAPEFLFSTHLLGILLSGAAIFLFWHRRRIAGSKRMMCALYVMAVVTALGTLFLSGSFPERVTSKLVSRQLIVLVVTLLSLYLWMKGIFKGSILGYTLILIVLFDLLGQNGRYVNTIDRSFYSTYPRSMEFIRKDDSLFRVNYAIGDGYKMRHRIQSYSLDDEAYNKWRETLSTSFLYGGVYVWKAMDGKPSIGIQRQNEFHHAFERGYMGASLSGPSLKALSLLNVKYLVRTEEINSKALTLVYTDPNGVRIYENREVLPRAFIVGDSVVLSKDEVLEFMKGGHFEPQRHVVLEEPTGPMEAAAPGEGQPCATPAIIDYSQAQVTLETACERPGFLVLSDSYYPGWKAYMDGVEAKVYLANYVMRAVSLPTGKHKVEFRYDPAVFRIGAFISTATLVALALYFLFPSRRRTSAERAA